MQRHLKTATAALVPLVASALVLSLPRAARADGTSLRADLIEAKSIKLDGVPKEWGGLVDLHSTLRGRAGKPDIEARAAIAYDATTLFVAADVTDDVLRGGGGDHVEVVLGFPGGATQEIELYPGEPGRSAGVAKTRDGAAIAGAKVVEAPRAGGWSLEAAVPWAAFPLAKQVRVGLRAGIFVHDADAGFVVKNVIGTAPSTAYGSLPPLNTEAEQSVADGLLKDKGLHGAPRFNLIADVAGDGMKERVLVYDRYLVVLGSNFRKGHEYYFADLGVPAENLISCEVRDLTGDGLAEILLRKRFGTATKYREMLQVLSFGSGEVPTMVFSHEIAVTTDGGSVGNEVSFVADGGKTAIRVATGSMRGFTASTYREPTETSTDPVLLPWATVKAQLYKFSGTAFTKVSEEKQAAVAAVPASDTGLPTAPPAPSADELLEKVYDLYKRDRGVTGRARFDRAVDVAGDGRAERVILHDRDLVVFGKGFKSGSGYAYLTLQQFAAQSDILDLTARDVTGDGKAEIIVKGVLHANAPPSVGGIVDREVVFVFQVQGDTIRRVFAAEVGRGVGKKRVTGAVRFSAGGIEIGPGTATDWTEKSYPFNQDAGPVGGLEPLLLPWGGASPVRYRWSGTSFTR